MMEKELERYRKTLQSRMGCYRLLSLLYLLVTVGTRFAAEEAMAHPAFGFLQGCGCAAMVLAVVQIVRMYRAFKDETTLRRLYNQEHDERMQAIRAKAGLPVTLIMSMMMIAGGLLCSLINVTAALTLVAAGVVQMLVSLVIKLWYMRRM